ncbi:PhzF family phenazine biosynthesis protein [Acidaminobacter hydrogenoformans]|uniref:Phenazine biosynthesis protein PhzF family n=1 Tax=Acidaminobacter hydrogenoformans DSM 2784 TaxID=1120920 RepID=A0A1G5RWM2_9FIRM|nr:PhzF family phenazine biosynthesis protein [Acidaminobacter hydrogenoformans]SCZ78443.1 phenazine biosynthesis protein PhzF family [Acidaminobacter hydrogenoformans DSM 2784]
MKIPYYQLAAFTDKQFAGNPSAICPLEEFLDEALMQKIARENNPAETTFIVKRDGYYDARWFTDNKELDLSGHGTLSSAFVVFTALEPALDRVKFQTKSGILEVYREGDHLALDLPARPAVRAEMPYELVLALGKLPRHVYRYATRDYMLIYDDEDQIKDLDPDFEELLNVQTHGVICTAPGKEVDFVSRYFMPVTGKDEDPVAGSAHCTLAPYWQKELGKTVMSSKQLSKRGGNLMVEVLGDRVKLMGKVVSYMEGTITI